MENNNVYTQLDTIKDNLLGGGKSSESEGFNDNEILGQIMNFAGEHFNSENLLSMLEQIKSLIKENVTQENLNSIVQTIKSTYNNNQESIKNGLGNVLNLIKSFDKSGKVTGFIECLQNDINDPNCSQEILGTGTADQSRSMAFVTKVRIIYLNYYDADLLMAWNFV